MAYDIKDFIDHGATHVVNKPFDVDEFDKMMRDIDIGDRHFHKSLLSKDSQKSVDQANEQTILLYSSGYKPSFCLK